MRTRILSIISIGITIGFLLGMGVVALLRSLLDSETPQLEAAFTMMVVMMGGGLVYYVYKTVR
jgi:NhaP-type Na+/H+ or K+/H+ antiporter